MENLTLVIPAKFEASTLPTVLKEIENLNLNCKKIIISNFNYVHGNSPFSIVIYNVSKITEF